MNIAFDALAILGAMSKNRGIGNYALSQFQTMIATDKTNKYFFFNCIEPFHLFADNNTQDNLVEEFFYLGKNFALANNPTFAEVYGELIKSFIKKNNIDVFYITSPFDGHIIGYRKEWFEGVKTVATVYDIIPYIFKKHYLNDKNTKEWYLNSIEQLRWPDKLLVISESVKNDLVNYLQFDPNKINCIWGAVNDRYRIVNISDKDKKYFLATFGIKDNFIMCTGGDDERKNIAGLIKAYSQLSKDLRDRYQLVIVCKLSQQAVVRYTELAKELNIFNNVILTNFVSDEDLLKLYNMASLMAFPSKYEGFGLPVVEAFACGTPVLTSNNSSLVEIAGNAAYLVDPFDINSITDGLDRALTDEKIDDMVQLGFKQLEKFQWSNVADAAVRYISELNTISKLECIDCKKKLACFTPLPPIQSGIADYSVDILNVLSRYFAITVFIDDGYVSNCNLTNGISVCNYRKFSKNDFDYVLYQYGNSVYHNYMNSYIRRFGGIVVLHDYNLYGLVSSNYLSPKNTDFKKYAQILEEDYPKSIVEQHIEEFKTKGIFYSMPVNGFIINYADKVIVHSDENREALLRKDISRNVKIIRHYAKINDIISPLAAKEKLGISSDTKIIAAFGHIHETKRIIPILRVIASLREKYQKFKVILCGKIDENIKTKFEAFVMKNGLEDIVFVTGYVDLDKFLQYLDATDICLNLRYPYNGETSGSLMRILAKQKCVIVNNIGSFSEIPDTCCIKLPNVEKLSEEQEVHNLYEKLENLLMEPDKINKYGVAARRYAEENLDLNIICDEYYEFIIKKSISTLTEAVLSKFKMEEIDSNYYSPEQIQGIAKTLSYIKVNG